MPTIAAPRGDDLDADYVNEEYDGPQPLPAHNNADTMPGSSHINAFAFALAAEDDNSDAEGSGLQSPVVSPMSPRTRVRKISALSDFAPIAQKVTRSVLPAAGQECES